MSEPDISILTCMPWRPDLDLEQIPGSKKVTADCGHEVVMAPTGQAHNQRPDIYSECLDCTIKNTPERIMKHGPSTLHAAPGAKEEAIAALGVHEFDQRSAELRNEFGITFDD